MKERLEQPEEEPEEEPLLSRRDLLKIVGVSLVGTGVGSTAPALLDVGQEVLLKEQLAQEVAKSVAEIEHKYGVRVRFDENAQAWGELYSSEALYEAAKVRALRHLETELKSYPKALFRPFPFQIITLRNNIQERGVDRGFAEGTLIQGARNPHHGLILDVGGHAEEGYRHFGWNERRDFRVHFSHEFFHAVDTFNDDVWLQQFPPPSTTYSDDVTDEEIPGYARGYGLFNPKEDRASIYEELATDNSDFKHRLRTDEVLAAKTRRIKDYISQISGGLIDNEYWEVRNTQAFNRRTEDYFRNKARRLVEQTYEAFCTRNPSQVIDVTQETYERWQQQAREDYLST